MSVAKSCLLAVPTVPVMLALSLAAAVIVSFAADQAAAAEPLSTDRSAAERFAAPRLAASIVDMPAPYDIQVTIRVGAMDLDTLGLETFGDLDEKPR